MMKNSKSPDLDMIEDYLYTLNKGRAEYQEKRHNCMRFIKSVDMLLKGEKSNLQSELRKTLMTGIYMPNCQLIGKNYMILLYS